MHLKVLFHDNCFDGACSAAVFTRFYRERIRPDVQVSYEGLAHKAGGSAIDPAVFTGDENAIVDFRYSQDPRLTWSLDSTARIPVFSAGAAVRFNLLGAAVLEIYFAWPFQRPAVNGSWGFLVSAGW